MLRRDGVLLDRFTARFGMRELTIQGGKFHLNGAPMFLKATFFEGLYPVKLAYPDSREMAAREIRLAKEAGFNMIRPWRKPPPPMWLDLADEIGVLTVGSLAIECMDFPIETPRLPGWVANEVRCSILRDRNRACVVQWELFNELKRPVLKQLLHPSAMLARQLDPTRLILDESGGWAQGANMYLPYQTVPTKFNDIHHYPGQQINDEIYEKLRWTAVQTPEQMQAMGLSGKMPGRNVAGGLTIYFSELGYGSMPNLVDNNRRFEKIGNPIVPPTVYHRRLADQYAQALEATGFDDLYPDLKQFCFDQQTLHGTANKRMIEAVRTNPLVIGYCIHALTAGDWIIGCRTARPVSEPQDLRVRGDEGRQPAPDRLDPRAAAQRLRGTRGQAQHHGSKRARRDGRSVDGDNYRAGRHRRAFQGRRDRDGVRHHRPARRGPRHIQAARYVQGQGDDDRGRRGTHHREFVPLRRVRQRSVARAEEPHRRPGPEQLATGLPQGGRHRLC